MTTDFRQLTSAPADSYKKPKPLPQGTYFGTIIGRKYDTSKNENNTPYVQFDIKVTHAGNDVDTADLEGVELEKKQLRSTFYLTPDAGYRLPEFAASLGIDVSSKNIGEIVEELLNQSVMMDVVLKPAKKNPSEFYNEIAKLSPPNGE